MPGGLSASLPEHRHQQVGDDQHHERGHEPGRRQEEPEQPAELHHAYAHHERQGGGPPFRVAPAAARAQFATAASRITTYP
ncbi:hypothetical protein [Micromonospora sp. MH33]|uniref:hypothetical protein n=1 Tax=Micromonospora sp. MH33 TaxID=1945509 RepID=UPI001FED8B38|nr:hypothetical protein [Micromonospora sp. MH33]